MSAFLANRWRPAHAIERSTSHRFGMTAHPVCPGGFSIMILTKVPSRFHVSKEERTKRIGGTSAGSMRHWQPVRCLESSALTIARRSMSVGRPPLGDGVTTSGARAAHCASGRSVASCVGESQHSRFGIRYFSVSESHVQHHDTTNSGL